MAALGAGWGAVAEAPAAEAYELAPRAPMSRRSSSESESFSSKLFPRTTLTPRERHGFKETIRHCHQHEWLTTHAEKPPGPRLVMTQERREALRRAFDDIDEKKDGYVSENLLLPPMRAIGVGREQIRAQLAKGGRETLDFDGFCALVVNAKPENGRPKCIDAIAHDDSYDFSLVINSARISKLIDSYTVSPPTFKRVATKQPGTSKLSRGRSRAPRRDVDLARIKCVSKGILNDQDEFATWLFRAGIDLKEWGSGGAKTVHDLLQEVEADECTVQNVGGEECMRVVRVVKMVVRRPNAPGHFLVNVRQRMADGRMRSRHVMASEKVHAGEDSYDAARRGLLEELGDFIRDPAQINVVDGSMLEWYELVESPSYPHLSTQYQLSQIEAIVDGLPSEPFATVEGRKKHFWEWWTDEDAEAHGAHTLRRRS